MELDIQTIKIKMRRFRTKSGISASEMAEVAGVSESTIRRYDDPSDPREPSLLAVARICAHYGISVDWLLFGSTENIGEDVRFRMMLDNLSHNLSPESQIAFTTFIQGVYDLALRLGRDGAPLVDLQLDG